MLASFRLTLGFLTGRERFTYFSLLVVRALTGVLDVFGILLIGLLAGVASTQLGDPSAEPLTIVGITLPALDQQGLITLMLFVLLVFALKAVIAIVLSRTMTRFVARVESENATKIAEYILGGRLGDVQKYSKADVQFAVTTSSVYAFTGLLNNLVTLVSETFLLLLLGGTFVAVNPVAALAVTAYFTGIILIIQFAIGHQLKKAGRDAVAGTIGSNSTVNDTLDTFREISVLSKQPTFIRRFSEYRTKVSQSGGTMTFLSGMPRYVVETSLILGVVLFVGVLFLTGQLASGLVTIGVFLTGGVRIMGSLLPLQNAVAQLKNNREQAASAQALLVEANAAAAQPADARAAAPAVEFTAAGALGVVVEGVDFTHPGNQQRTLDGVSLTIPGGSHVAFIGPSGAGKTTLVDLLLGLITPDSGTVTIGGVEPGILRASDPGLISYVPQKPGLVSGTIAENIALGVEAGDIDLERVAEVLEAAHLTEFITTLPDGVLTSVGKQADALSGGQIQRLGLARALYTRPRLLILDEATSALDAGSEAFVTASLDALGKGVTVVIIAHRLSTVQHSDAVHVVENGAITASGKFSTLRRTVPMVAEYVKLMSFEE